MMVSSAVAAGSVRLRCVVANVERGRRQDRDWQAVVSSDGDAGAAAARPDLERLRRGPQAGRLATTRLYPTGPVPEGAAGFATEVPGSGVQPACTSYNGCGAGRGCKPVASLTPQRCLPAPSTPGGGGQLPWHEPKLPPSLNRAWGAAATEQSETDARERKVEEALRSLPLTDDARSQVSNFVSLFERTYEAVKRQKDDHPVSGAIVERELSDLVRKCDSLGNHLMGMHQDTIRLHGRAAGASRAGWMALAMLRLCSQQSNSAAEWAERRSPPTKRSGAPQSGATPATPWRLRCATPPRLSTPS